MKIATVLTVFVSLFLMGCSPANNDCVANTVDAQQSHDVAINNDDNFVLDPPILVQNNPAVVNEMYGHIPMGSVYTDFKGTHAELLMAWSNIMRRISNSESVYPNGFKWDEFIESFRTEAETAMRSNDRSQWNIGVDVEPFTYFKNGTTPFYTTFYDLNIDRFYMLRKPPSDVSMLVPLYNVHCEIDGVCRDLLSDRILSTRQLQELPPIAHFHDYYLVKGNSGVTCIDEICFFNQAHYAFPNVLGRLQDTMDMDMASLSSLFYGLKEK